MIWTLVTSRLSPAVLLFCAVVIFYEGLPIGPLRQVPYLGPVLQGFTDGRVDRARKDGARDERTAWEQARAELLAEMERQRLEAQARIDAAEKDYLNRSQADALRIAALEAAISAELEAEANEPKNPACPARPAVPRGLSRQLDAIGR